MSNAITFDDIVAARKRIAAHIQPLRVTRSDSLSTRFDSEIMLAHEYLQTTGAFKLRGGLVFMDSLKKQRPEVTGVIAATRGNHGQSIALAARTQGLKCVVVVPHGNSVEKNRAMRAFGAELIERLAGREKSFARYQLKGELARGGQGAARRAPCLPERQFTQAARGRRGHRRRRHRRPRRHRRRR